jgi:carbamate kinase
MRGFGTPEQAAIHRESPAGLRQLDLPAGSMGPKVDAVCRFVERTGGVAAIGALEDAVAVLAGTSGTVVTATGRYDGPVHAPGTLR